MPDRPVSEFLCPLRAKRARRKEARPGELLQAALDLFVDKGFAATRVEEVAARAGVSKGTLFLYFKTKEELFQAVVTHNIAGLFVQWEQEFLDFEGSTPEMLRYCMRTWWERVGLTQASGITKLILAEGRNFPELADFYRREVVKPGQALIRRMLERGVARGEFEIDDMDHTLYAVIAPMLFLMLWRHSANACVDAELDPERYLQALSDTVLRGLCTPSARKTLSSPPAS